MATDADADAGVELEMGLELLGCTDMELVELEDGQEVRKAPGLEEVMVKDTLGIDLIARSLPGRDWGWAWTVGGCCVEDGHGPGTRYAVTRFPCLSKIHKGGGASEKNSRAGDPDGGRPKVEVQNNGEGEGVVAL